MSQPEFAEEDVTPPCGPQHRGHPLGRGGDVHGGAGRLRQEETARASDELSSFLDDSLHERLGQDVLTGYAAATESALTLTGGDRRFFRRRRSARSSPHSRRSRASARRASTRSVAGVRRDPRGDRGERAGAADALPGRALGGDRGRSEPRDVQSAAQCVALTFARWRGSRARGDRTGVRAAPAVAGHHALRRRPGERHDGARAGRAAPDARRRVDRRLRRRGRPRGPLDPGRGATGGGAARRPHRHGGQDARPAAGPPSPVWCAGPAARSCSHLAAPSSTRRGRRRADACAA